jgi:dihydroflavonol-4-reductase
LIYTSSIHALAKNDQDDVVDERVSFDPERSAGAYDRSKARASLEVLKGVQKGLDAVIVCPTGVIGPFDYKDSEMGMLILDSAKSGLSLSVNGAYDFVDVRDVSRGEILSRDFGRKGETYILSGERITIGSVIQIAKNLVNHTGQILQIPISFARFISMFTPFFYKATRTKPRFTPYSIETVSGNSKFSHEKATNELGYSSRSLRESIKDTIEWFIQGKKLSILPSPIYSKQKNDR